MLKVLLLQQSHHAKYSESQVNAAAPTFRNQASTGLIVLPESHCRTLCAQGLQDLPVCVAFGPKTVQEPINPKP